MKLGRNAGMEKSDLQFRAEIPSRAMGGVVLADQGEHKNWGSLRYLAQLN